VIGGSENDKKYQTLKKRKYAKGSVHVSFFAYFRAFRGFISSPLMRVL
jgi:hypothetical protein